MRIGLSETAVIFKAKAAYLLSNNQNQLHIFCSHFPPIQSESKRFHSAFLAVPRIHLKLQSSFITFRHLKDFVPFLSEELV